MTATQCDAAFGPKLFEEIELAKRHYAGGISRADLDEGEQISNFRIFISNARVYVKSWLPAYQSRIFSKLLSLQEAILTSPEPIPDLEVSITVSDYSPGAAGRWVTDRVADEAGRSWLAPDFAFSSWPEPHIGAWHDYRCRVNESRIDWRDKIDSVFWRGVPMTEGRQQLVALDQQHDWLDAKAVDWNDAGGRQHARIVTMPEHCQYKFLAHTEGVAYSGCVPIDAVP